MKYAYEIEFHLPAVGTPAEEEMDMIPNLLSKWSSRAWISTWESLYTPAQNRFRAMTTGLRQLEEGPSTLPLTPFHQRWVDTTQCQIHIRACGSMPLELAERATLQAMVLHFAPDDLLSPDLLTPLRDLAGFQLVPFHWIPNNQEGDLYYNLKRWFYNKEMLYKVWQASLRAHRLYTHELTHPAGAYHRKGRNLCAEVEQLSGLPTYQFIWRPPRRASLRQELAFQLGVDHKAASEIVTDHPHYQFINHEERLVANVAPNVLAAFRAWAAGQQG